MYYWHLIREEEKKSYHALHIDYIYIYIYIAIDAPRNFSNALVQISPVMQLLLSLLIQFNSKCRKYMDVRRG